MKIKKSFLQLKTFDSIASAYLIKNGYAELKDGVFHYTDKEPTKLVSAIKSVNKQLVKHFESLNDELDNLRIMNCATDPATKVQLPKLNGQRQYTVEGEIKLKQEVKLYLATEVEIHQRIVVDFEKLSELELETFSEIVIPKQTFED